MPLRVLLLLFTAAVLAFKPAHGVAADKLNFKPERSFRIGVPGGAHPMAVTERNPWVRELLRELGAQVELQRVQGQNSTRLLMAVGNEYQQLDWLHKGLVDGAVLSPVAVELLRAQPAPRGAPDSASRDGSSRYRILDIGQRFSKIRALSNDYLRFRARIVSKDRSGQWRLADNPVSALVDALEKTAVSSYNPPQDSNVRLFFPSYLTQAMVFAVASFQQSLHARLAPPGMSEAEQVKVPEAIAKGLDRALEHAVLGYRNKAGEEVDEFLERAGATKTPASDLDTVIQLESISSGQSSAALGWTYFRWSFEGGLELDPEPAYVDLPLLLVPTEISARRFAGLKAFEPPRTALSAAIDELLDRPGIRDWVRKFRPMTLDAAPDFRFTVNEVVRFVGEEQVRTGEKELALVLPGGGVKSAYQSVFVDHLYRNELLKNIGSASTLESKGEVSSPIVKYVAGNSGGALLGSFVSMIRTPAQANLTTALWALPNDGKSEPEPYLRSHDIFPFVDMMRWLSIFVGAAVVVVMLIATGWTALRRRIRNPELNDLVPRQVDARSRVKVSLFWIVCLAWIPYGFKFVNGSYGAENVPIIGGFFYFLCFSLAVIGDNIYCTKNIYCIKPQKPARKWVAPGATAALGMLLCLLPVLSRVARGTGGGCPSEDDILEQIIGLWDAILRDRHDVLLNPLFDCLTHPGSEWKEFEVPFGSLLYCLGALLILAAGLSYICGNRGRFQVSHRRLTLYGYAFIVAVPAVSTLLLERLQFSDSINSAATLELTGEFWIWYLGIVTLLTGVVLVLVLASPSEEGLRGAMLKVFVFLTRRHPSNTVRVPRGFRIILFAGCAFVYWNAIVSPGLYGNSTAQGYLTDRYERWTGVGAEVPAPLQTGLVVPAVSLGADSDRYTYLFRNAGGDDKDTLEVSHEVRAKIDSDGRWTACKNPTMAVLKSIVFASGSPFPIFPAHRVAPCESSVSEGGNDEQWLVDGGYAHNIPIEGPRFLGAKQLMILASSPPDPTPVPEKYEPHKDFIGQLPRYLTRLIPFLYGRSQLVDELHRGGSFVVEVGPDAPANSWPNLTAFRRPVIANLIDTARRDIHRRTGRVLSWAEPKFWEVIPLAASGR